jgi:hypothetical protein
VQALWRTATSQPQQQQQLQQLQLRPVDLICSDACCAQHTPCLLDDRLSLAIIGCQVCSNYLPVPETQEERQGGVCCGVLVI